MSLIIILTNHENKCQTNLESTSQLVMTKFKWLIKMVKERSSNENGGSGSKEKSLNSCKISSFGCVKHPGLQRKSK